MVAVSLAVLLKGTIYTVCEYIYILQAAAFYTVLHYEKYENGRSNKTKFKVAVETYKLSNCFQSFVFCGVFFSHFFFLLETIRFKSFLTVISLPPTPFIHLRGSNFFFHLLQKQNLC